MASGTKRTPEEIRASIEVNRIALGESLGQLREEVIELTDWRSQLRENQQTLVIAAAAAGYVSGGGIGATFSLVFGYRRRRARRVAATATRPTPRRVKSRSERSASRHKGLVS